MLVFVFFILTSCSGEEITGDSALEVSTLTVIVVDEDDQLVPDAEIFINGRFKGKTNKYGENVGKKVVLLDGLNNQIQIEKDGYTPSKSTKISATFSGEQQITISLEKKKTNYHVRISDRGYRLEKVRVSLRQQGRDPIILYTDRDGDVIFEAVDDGEYVFTAALDKYQSQKWDQEINYADDGDNLRVAVELERLPAVEVEVIDTQGRPLRMAEVSLFRKSDYNNPGEAYPISREYSDSEGKVYFSAVEYNDQYVVVVKKQDFLAQAKEILLKPDNREMRFEMVFNVD